MYYAIDQSIYNTVIFTVSIDVFNIAFLSCKSDSLVEAINLPYMYFETPQNVSIYPLII